MSKYRLTISSKRQKLTQTLTTQPQAQDQDTAQDDDGDDHQPLLPGLPDHIAHLCLSHVHPSILHNVCHSWRRLIYSPSFPPFLSLYALFSPKSNSSSTPIHLFTFDPVSSTWDPLPPPPPDPPLHLILRHPSFLSRNLPVQLVSLSGKLILLAATTHNFNPALTRPLIFDPICRTWTFGPELVTPRRWCAAGCSRGAVHVASGIGSQFTSDVAKSVEKWDLMNGEKNSRWEKTGELKDGRFSREAIDAVGWKGKLCLVNVKGAEGAVYDVVANTWDDMREGMVRGWRGPVAAMDEEVLYGIDESSCTLSKYDEVMDDWKEVVKSDLLKGARHAAAGGGRVCAVCENGGGIVVVDVKAAAAPTIFVVDTPLGFEALSVHILPRMSKIG
ncbi:hypothetical protein AB3S75_012610 [Citrus x aurantiifolia]